MDCRGHGWLRVPDDERSAVAGIQLGTSSSISGTRHHVEPRTKSTKTGCRPKKGQPDRQAGPMGQAQPDASRSSGRAGRPVRSVRGPRSSPNVSSTTGHVESGQTPRPSRRPPPRFRVPDLGPTTSRPGRHRTRRTTPSTRRSMHRSPSIRSDRSRPASGGSTATSWTTSPGRTNSPPRGSQPR